MQLHLLPRTFAAAAAVAVFALTAAAAHASPYAELSLRNGVLHWGDAPQRVPGFDGGSFVQVPGVSIPVFRATAPDGAALGFVFLSTSVSPIPAYSGKPLEMLIAISPTGRILRVRVLRHQEPVLLAGIPESKLHEFTGQYVDLPVTAHTTLGREAGADRTIDAISGATVTALIADQTIMECAQTVAAALGIIDVRRANRALTSTFEPQTWAQLVASGAVAHLAVAEDAILHNGKTSLWLDLYVADVTHPTVGRNLLGDAAWESYRAEYGGASAVVVLNNGSYSFKGSGFVRGGIFDRIGIEQGIQHFGFRDTGYENVYAIAAKGAPSFQERALLVVQSGAFQPAVPWRFTVLIGVFDGVTTRSKRFTSVGVDYALPDSLWTGDRSLSGPGVNIGRIWLDKLPWLIAYLAIWGVTIAGFIRRESFRSMVALSRFHWGVLAASIAVLGIAQHGQPSVVNLQMAAGVAIGGQSWDIFLTEPFLFVSWILIAVTVLIWGRALFCGWICPFGALQHLLHEVPRALWFKTVGSWELPKRVHRKLVYLPYAVFGVLMTLSLISMAWGELAAEVEPFKSTWLIGIWNREWYFIGWWLLIVGFAITTNRPFCRYVCPLGGALGIASVVQRVRIRRRDFCHSCAVCRNDCSQHAISVEGKIDPTLCMGCHECSLHLASPTDCPPLKHHKVWEQYETGPWPGSASSTVPDAPLPADAPAWLTGKV